MKNLRLLFAVATSLLVSATVHAQLFRAYVSSTGNDANPCTLPSPCRLLPAALAAAAPGGEIWMLDSANYNTGAVNVTKSITILAIPGAVGSVLTTGAAAFVIATTGVDVVLRNLVVARLAGSGSAVGIAMTAGASLTIEQSLIANIPGHSVSVIGTSILRISDTTIRNSGDAGVIVKDGARASITRATISGSYGQAVLAFATVAATATTMDIADSTLEDSDNGIYAVSQVAAGPVHASVTGSRILRNSNAGAFAVSTAGGPVALSVSNNVISNNNKGIYATGGATAKIVASGNTVSANAVGLQNSSSTLESAGNNVVRNNLGANIGSVSLIGLQ